MDTLLMDDLRMREKSTMADGGLVSMDRMLAVTLVTEKVITLAMMAVATFLFGMLPLKLFAQLRNNPDVTSRIRLILICLHITIALSFCRNLGGVL